MCPSAWEPSECSTPCQLVRHWKWLCYDTIEVNHMHAYASCSGKLKSETVIIARINISFFILHLCISVFTLGLGDRSEIQRAWNFRPASWRRSCKVISLPGIMQTSRQKTQVSTCQLAPRSRQMGCGWMWQAPMVHLSSHCPLHHTHQTLQGAVEICETAFHTNPLLSSWLQVGHRTLGSSSTTGMTGVNWVNLKHCTLCYAVFKSCLCWSLMWLPKHVSSCRKDTWRPNAQQVGPWAAEAPWPGRRQPRSLDTAPLLCLSQTELPRFTLVQNRLVPDKYDKYVLGQQTGGTVSLWQFGGCNLFECYVLFHWNKNCISAAPLWISLTSSPSN